jgi:hypothetical protein
MSDVINNEVKDEYKEHPQHNTYQDNCSECYKENEIMKNFFISNVREFRM